MSCIDFLWISSCHHDKAIASIFPGKHCIFLLIPRLGFLPLGGEHTETALGPDWRGLAMKPSYWPVFMETFPVLPWRSKQDFPREAGLRGINDKESWGRPARSLGSGSSLFSPPASQGCSPSQPETDAERSSTKWQNYSIPAHTNAGHEWENILRNKKKKPRDTFQNPLERTGTCSRKKLKDKERFIPQ